MKRFLILSFLLIISATISRADWPLFHGDLERTGFSSISTTAGLVELWQADLGSPVYISPVVADGKVYVSTADARLFAFDAFTGVQLWQATPGSWLEASPTVFEGRLYLPCVDHFVYCYDAGDGSLLWEVETGSWVESSPLAFDGKVYVGGSDHQFYAFDALDGSLLFSIESEFDVITAPSTDGQNIFYAGDDEQIHAVTPDGAPLWTASAGGAVYGAPVVAEGKIIYASVANGSGLSLNRLAALSIATGAEIWSRNFEEYEFLYGTPAVAYGNVYIGDFQGSVHACNLDDGNPVWTRSLGDWALLSSPALSNGVLYSGSNDGYIYALDAFTGVVLDSRASGAFIQSSPAASDGNLYVGSADGILRAFDLDSPVEVIATPLVTSVPPGGSLEFAVELNELQGQSQSFLAWPRVTRPNGAQRDLGNPVVMTLSPGQQFSTNAQLSVPTFAPPGEYFLAINAGSAQDLIWDASSFAFTITGLGDESGNEKDWEFNIDAAGALHTASAPELPADFALHPPHPNPFNPATMLTFSLPQAADVSLKVYDASGRWIVTLTEGYHSAGVHQFRWDASGLASGMYLVKLTAAGKTAVSRATLTK